MSMDSYSFYKLCTLGMKQHIQQPVMKRLETKLPFWKQEDEKILNYLSDWNGAIDKEIDGIFFIKGVLFSVSVERRHRNCINWADTDRGPSPEQV